MKRLLLLLILIPYGPPAFPVFGQSVIEESAVTFRIRNAGITVEGSLEGLEADIIFNPLHPEQGQIRASVPVNTIRTGIGLRDKHLQKPEYFDAAKHPLILLSSKSVRRTGKGKYQGTFTLSIKGIEREVVFPFTVSPVHEFNGKFRVNRLDFGLGKESLVLSDEVEVAIRVKLRSMQSSALPDK